MNFVQFLHDLIPWGYRILLGFEELRTPAGDIFFRAVTHLGDEEFWIILFAVVYWCFSKETGRKLSFIYLTSSYLNIILKYSFAIPRPGDPWTQKIALENNLFRLSPVGHETTPSFPSNHAQGVLVGWIFLALQTKNRWFWLISFLMIFLVGLSRMYLGVHFPQDILGGWLIGYIFLRMWLWLEPGIKKQLKKVALLWQGVGILVIPIIFILIWPQESASKILGAISGLGLGYMIEGRMVRFIVESAAWKKIVRAVIGLIIVFAVSKVMGMLTGAVESGLGPSIYGVTVWAAYVLTGLTAGALVPGLMVALRLAERESQGS